MRRTAHTPTPPPCAQKCWEPLPGGAWRYTASASVCGHHFDPEQRIWRWTPPPTRTEETT